MRRRCIVPRGTVNQGTSLVGLRRLGQDELGGMGVKMCNIHVGGEEAEYLALTVHGRADPGSSDFWDANWLTCTVEVAAGGFRGRFDCSIRTEEFERFYEQLVPLYERLSGDAQLESLEDWLSVRLVGDGRGHIEARCQLRDAPGSGNALACRLHFDQTLLPPLLRQLAAVREAYPVVGR